MMTRISIVLLAAAALLGACGRADSDIRAHVQAQLAVDAQTREADVTVDVEDGVVYLRGEVPSREAQRRAVEVAEAVDSVDTVIDELRLSDAVVAQAVKAALGSDPLVGDVAIAVSAREGVVRLTSGDTSRDERERAAALAAEVDGVDEVQDWMK